MSFKFALKQYITNPHVKEDQFIYEDEDFVVIKDAFPKASFHYLLLPRDLTISKQNPLISFQDDELRLKAAKLIERFKKEILDLFKKKYDIKDDQSFDEDRFVKAGVHSVPSLNNLHVHIISQDFNSIRLKNKHHYNSFTTEFFVDFDELPLEKEDRRLDVKSMEHVVNKSDLICVYCDKNFHNKFAELKRHLLEEFNSKYKVRVK